MAFNVLWPTAYGKITQRFNENPEVYNKFGLPGHEGLDFRAPDGSEIFAVAGGFVSDIRLDGFSDPMLKPYGNQVRIKHDNGFESIYAHLSQVVVTRGQYIIGKQLIALAGNTGHSTGAHLHFSLKKHGATQRGETAYPYDLVDPEPYLESFRDEGAREPVPPESPSMLVYVNSPDLDYVNMRAAPYIGADLIQQVPHNAPVGSLEPLDRTYLKVGHEGLWLWVRTEEGVSGYMAAWYLRHENGETIPPEILDKAYLVIVDSDEDKLKLRTGPGTAYDIVASFETGTILRALEDEQAVKDKVGTPGEWLYVYAPGDRTGFCAAWYLKLDPSSGGSILPDPHTGEPTKYVVVESPQYGLKVRSGPGTDYERIWRVPHKTALLSLEDPQLTGNKIAQLDQWLHIQTPSLHQGYVAAWYLRHPTQVDDRQSAVSMDIVTGTSPHIFGIHAVSISDDPAQQEQIRQLYDGSGKQGWVLFTEVCGRHAHTIHPVGEINNRFWHWADQGFGVIIRLNHGYEPGGTLPESQFYDDYASAAARWAEVFLKSGSRSADEYTWTIQIGNEQNNPREHPGGYEHPAEHITAAKYANAFNLTYEKIKKVLPNATVCPGAIDPYNYMPMKKLGETRWRPLDYFTEMMDRIDALDGVILHAYTHGPNLDYVTHLKQFGDGSGPLWDHYYDFQSYRTFIECIPSQWHDVPVYITEINHIHRPAGEHELGWVNQNTGFIREIYEEIDRWNQSPYAQQIRCGLIYRWIGDQWAIADKGEVLADFRSALHQDRRWRIHAGGAYAFMSSPEASPAEEVPSGIEERRLLHPDDLTMIWGIGDKTQAILHAAGIYIFDQLVDITPRRLAEIIGESELRSRFIPTWPEQAQLASRGDWEALENYNDRFFSER
ncbi:MAG: peptidoglycan DD-metalloendopeptidase family protein [Anaerolineae bacterium]|nr:peptidoglycan DD-metalloendopeptidase family protein [Anaerolineae bacterium]